MTTEPDVGDRGVLGGLRRAYNTILEQVFVRAHLCA